MRVLSFIPAFLLAAASFVAAAPADLTDCIAPPSGGGGDDKALQPAISIITDATSKLEPLNLQLTHLKGDNCNACTADAVSGVVVQITAVVKACVDSLEATAVVDLSVIAVARLVAAITGLVRVVLKIVASLVAIILLRLQILVQIKAVVQALIAIILKLVVCLRVYAVARTGVLVELIAALEAAVHLCLSVIVGAKVVA